MTWLTGRTPEFRETVAYVAIDPAAVYAAAVRTAGLLPNATVVVDHFHLVALANLAVTKTRRGSAPDPAPVAPVPGLVHRLEHPRADRPGEDGRRLVARDQRVRSDRDHQRPHRGLQPAREGGEALGLWVQEPEELREADTLPLHPHATDCNSDFMLISRSKLKSHVTTPSLPQSRLELHWPIRDKCDITAQFPHRHS